MIIKKYTGHMYRNSPYETDSDCGNCNGARCENCIIKFVSTETNKVCDTIEESKENEKAFKMLINDLSSYNITFFIKNDKLYCINIDDKKDAILCNEESPLYQEYFDTTKQKVARYTECVCNDKDDANNQCSKYGCDDSSCYIEMKRGKRIEKKWYM